MKTFEELQENLSFFLEDVSNFLLDLDIDVTGLVSDHVGLRFAKKEDVEETLKNFVNFGSILSDATVNGRKIYILKLNAPLVYKAFSIQCIELPYPKEGHDYPEGLEHIEFVVPTNNVSDFERTFKQKFPRLTQDLLKKYNYKLTVPKAEGNQLPNPSAALTKRPGLTIKFHPHTIEDVVRG